MINVMPHKYEVLVVDGGAIILTNTENIDDVQFICRQFIIHVAAAPTTIPQYNEQISIQKAP